MWLSKGNFKSETESFLTAAQNNDIMIAELILSSFFHCSYKRLN